MKLLKKYQSNTDFKADIFAYAKMRFKPMLRGHIFGMLGEKLRKKFIKILSLAFMSLTGFLSYYAEVLIYGWEGLKWTGNFYWHIDFYAPMVLLKSAQGKSCIFRLISVASTA